MAWIISLCMFWAYIIFFYPFELNYWNKLLHNVLIFSSFTCMQEMWSMFSRCCNPCLLLQWVNTIEAQTPPIFYAFWISLKLLSGLLHSPVKAFFSAKHFYLFNLFENGNLNSQPLEQHAFVTYPLCGGCQKQSGGHLLIRKAWLWLRMFLLIFFII